MKKVTLTIEARIALLYLLFSSAWILFSDRVVMALVSDPNQLTVVQTYKGWFFVVVSALLIYTLLQGYLARQHRTDMALQNKQEQYRQIFETSRDAILLTAPDGSIFSANPAACRIFLRTEAEICQVGRNGLMDLNDSRLPLALAQRAQTGHFSGELTFVRGNGSSFPGEVSTSLFKDLNGEARTSMVIRDLTERKRAEAQILHLNQLYATLSQINQAIVHNHDSETLYKEICRVAIAHGKFAMCWIGLINPQDNTVRPVEFAGNEQGYLKNLTIKYLDEELGRGPTGTAVREGRCVISEDIAADPHMAPWRASALQHGFKSSAAVPFRRQGQIIGALMVYSAEVHGFDPADEKLLDEIGIDISFALDAYAAEAAHRQMEQAIAATRDRLNRILDGITDAFIALDRNWQITYINPEAARIAKKPPEALAGKTHWELWPEPLNTAVERQYRKAMIERVTVHFEHSYSATGQSDLWLDVCAYPNEDGLAIYLRDITLQRRAQIALREREEQLRRLNAELEQRVTQRTVELNAALLKAQDADRLKSAFLATMSHELRTPLNSIIGFTGVLAQGLAGPLNPEQTKQLGMVRQSSQHLLHLINDILDLSKIEAGQLEVKRSVCDLHGIVEEVLKLNLPAAQKKGLTLQCSFESSVGAVFSDRRRVEQILLNLVSNAVKFTETGEVTIECSAAGDWVKISVRDTGIGIKPEDLEHLFLPFRQIETGLDRRHEGTGLGLSICKHLVNLLGGEISAQSEPGKGSVFAFTLPAHAATS